MNRNTIKIILITVVVSLIGFFVIKTFATVRHKKKIRQRLTTSLNLPLVDLDSIPLVQDSHGKATLVVYFNPDCEHCQAEAKTIQSHIDDFKEINILFVSSEPIRTLRQFQGTYGLRNIPNVQFGKIDPSKAFDTFGSVTFPYLLIYDANNHMIMDFKGGIKLKTLLDYCKKAAQ